MAESAYFANRCEEENINFIGPSADAIYKMGNKSIAKQIASRHKINHLKGSKGIVSSTNEAVKIARDIGFPVILKAAAGGGGKGMRIVREEDQLEKMFRLASSEAQNAFSDSSLLLEKYVENPRHIEFQIVGDQFGNYVHLGERECSVQRKHQKLIEESPSPALDNELRKEMGLAAIKIAEAVKYYNLGTVEFLLDSEKNFYFLEMNTRIQVEHPVTELVTNKDLVELQIHIAEGKKLPFRQKDININGAAIEFRINAEDVQSGFAPCTGIIENINYPKGSDIRLDYGVVKSSVVTEYFDSMLAKLIVYGENREKALQNGRNALKKFYIKGIKTTVPFFKEALKTKSFTDGTYDTSFVETELERTYEFDPDAEMAAALFATLDYLHEKDIEDSPAINENGQHISPWILNKRMKSL
jgi:acetyl-CoA carboxylase biotin carboxylase subunit